MIKRLLVTFTVASSLLAVAALLQPAFAAQPTQTQDTQIGQVLANGQGLTLYTFDKDEAGKSACEGACAEKWPPFMAAADQQPEGDYTQIERSDGSKQWAYKGKPLYLMSDDAAPGDTKGEGFKEVWHAARP
jgi:predicted lipoprotein with Yx(FWY)xxD motif